MTAISGLYAVTPDEHDTQLLVKRVEAALAGGVRFLQYRNKIADAALRHSQAVALHDLCKARGAALIINDCVELARDIGAAGVHVGEDDAAIAHARTLLGSGTLIGASCYNDLGRAHFAKAQGADYVAFGSFFASTVKPDARRAPLALLSEARRQIKLPVVAIGGITLTNAPQLVAAGADALAVISALFSAPDVQAAARAFTVLFPGAST